jgi:hypothetical protein
MSRSIIILSGNASRERPSRVTANGETARDVGTALAADRKRVRPVKSSPLGVTYPLTRSCQLVSARFVCPVSMPTALLAALRTVVEPVSQGTRSPVVVSQEERPVPAFWLRAACRVHPAPERLVRAWIRTTDALRPGPARCVLPQIRCATN